MLTFANQVLWFSLSFLLFWPWRSVAISWLRPSSQSACHSWQMNSAPLTACPTWVWLRRSAVWSWRWQCWPTWAETCWRCLSSSSMRWCITFHLWNVFVICCKFWVCFFLATKPDSYLRCLNDEEKDEVVQLRMQGDRRLCSLRKENLTSWNDPETECARYVFTLKGPEDSGDWYPVTEFPFRADKWCFTTVVLYNYLYIIGGYRQRVRRGWEFKMASFRYNPLTNSWVTTAPLIKVRQPSSQNQPSW